LFDNDFAVQYNDVMILDEDKAKIADISSRYGVTEILLFGSGADPESRPNDIDLAVNGIKPEQFFSFYGDLIFALSKPVDLIDLSKKTKFNQIVQREGIRLYGKD
jgi:uncharacterized protein